ncbi:MAG: aldehyde ferredoxin oxidoreductase family protein [bacterium]
MRTAKYLKADLTTGKTSDEPIAPAVLEDFIGGVGLATALLFESGAYGAEPLSPENTFVLAVGPLTGSMFPGNSRLEIAFRSPLTGGFGSASAGGFFGPELKKTGYEAIVITGRSASPVYLFVGDGGAEILDAASLWGMDTYATEEEIRRRHNDKNVRVACIGPAGENLVRFACLMAGRHNYAARGGPGAVLGVKNLKAIAVRGSKKFEPADKGKYSETVAKIKKKLDSDLTAQTYSAYGTDSTMELGMMVSDVPTRNWRVATWFEGAEKLNGITMAKTILSGRKSCFACPVGCKRVVTVKDGAYRTENAVGPEYETAASFGTLLLNDDLAAVCEANRLCNTLGMDTISAGSTIAFTIEAFEKGLITAKDAGGVRPAWGDAAAILALIGKIARREGIGDKMAEGTRRMSEMIGGGSAEFAVQSKGMELPMHDPRAYHSLALAYATSPRGACHIKHMNIVIEMGVYFYPELGIKRHYHPLSREKKAEMTARSEELGFLVSSLALCMFTAWCLSVNDISDMLESTTGVRMDVETLRRVGERTLFLQRAFNTLCGFTDRDDSIPLRAVSPHPEGAVSGLDNIIFNLTKTPMPRNPGVRRVMLRLMDRIAPLQGRLIKGMGKLLPFRRLNRKQMEAKENPDFEFMKREYYRVRSLDSRGVPAREKLLDLGLENAVEALKL